MELKVRFSVRAILCLTFLAAVASYAISLEVRVTELHDEFHNAFASYLLGSMDELDLCRRSERLLDAELRSPFHSRVAAYQGHWVRLGRIEGTMLAGFSEGGIEGSDALRRYQRVVSERRMVESRIPGSCPQSRDR